MDRNLNPGDQQRESDCKRQRVQRVLKQGFENTIFAWAPQPLRNPAASAVLRNPATVLSLALKCRMIPTWHAGIIVQGCDLRAWDVALALWHSFQTPTGAELSVEAGLFAQEQRHRLRSAAGADRDREITRRDREN
jgi:hypothetical protein